MKKEPRRANISLKYIIIIMLLTAVVSGVTAGVIVYTSYSKKTGITYSSINNDPALKEFLDVYSSVSNDYYKEVDKNKMIDAAITGMLNYLGDKYTTYLDKNETDMLHDSLAGEYKGIGVAINDHTIMKVFSKSPAEKAGLLAGDEIIKINGNDTTNMTGAQIADSIKDKNLKSVSITVKRSGEEKNFDIETSNLYVPAIDSKMLEGTSIGYIRLETFSSSVSNQVEDAINDLNNHGMTSLVIDLRYNSGGFLSAAENVASLFLEKGKTIYSLTNKKGSTAIKDKTKASMNIPIVVIINKGSASAAEILAAALKDSYGATLVGTVSYGKGKVQQTYTLKDGSMAKYTSAKWDRPNGENIDGIGIKPDYEIELETVNDENGEIVSVRDTQLEKAKELLMN